LKEDLKSYEGKQLKKGKSFKIRKFGSDGNASIGGGDYIREKDFGKLGVTVVVAWPAVPC